MTGRTEGKTLASNRAAFHNYFIEERYEAGIALLGTEVKSLREGQANLKDAFARVKDGEVFLYNCHVAPYSHGNISNHDPLRTRKLLLRRSEIRALIGKTVLKGYTLVPLRFYLKGPHIKLEIGLAKGKKLHDRRETERRREIERETRAAMKSAR
ncbi:MAG: SsrA-binding protein [Acidobacteria bacterium]|nr:MAG: SsrA-binding protein [Acidobacteriota bacterium]